MRFFLLLSFLFSSTVFASFDHCRLRAIDGDPPRYVNVCRTPSGEMHLNDYFRYLDNGLKAPTNLEVIADNEFLPESDYPSRASEIDPAQLSDSLRRIAELGRVSDSEQMLRARERENNFDSIEERIRKLNEARDRLERERELNSLLDPVYQLRNHLRSSNPMKRVGIISLMEAQSSKKDFSGEYGERHRALKKKFSVIKAEDIQSHQLVGSSAQTFLRSEKEYESGEKDFASELLSLSESLLDVGLGIAPGSSLVKDTYELIFGTNMVTGVELSSLDRGISLVGVGLGIASFGTAGGVATTLFKSKRLVKLADHFGAVSAKFLKTSKSVFDEAGLVGEKIVEAGRALKFKSEGTINRFSQFNKQILKADIDGMKMLDKIVETSQNIKPKFGNKYVKSLPEDFKYRKAFDGYANQGVYEPGELLFQAQRRGQNDPGNWFTPIKPLDSNHADDLLNIKKYGNDAFQIKAYIIKERVSGYAGKVTNGTGYQFYIPEGTDLTDILEEVILD